MKFPMLRLTLSRSLPVMAFLACSALHSQAMAQPVRTPTQAPRQPPAVVKDGQNASGNRSDSKAQPMTDSERRAYEERQRKAGV